MTWARFDDEYDDNPKVRAAGKDGRALDQPGIRYAAKHLTNGLIPDHDLPVLAAKADVPLKRTLRKLIEVGRWHGPGHDCDHDCPPCPPGYHVVHDYLDYNPSAEAELEKRRKRAEAGRKGGRRSRPPSSKPEANGEANALTSASANAQASAKQTANPVPVTPFDLHPPPTHGGTRPEPVGEGSGSIVEQAVQLAARRYGEHEKTQGRGRTVDGLANWWLQENADGAHVRAEKLLDDHDLTVTQLADALLEGNPRWLSSYRRRRPIAEEPLTGLALAVVKDITAGARDAIEHPDRTEAS